MGSVRSGRGGGGGGGKAEPLGDGRARGLELTPRHESWCGGGRGLAAIAGTRRVCLRGLVHRRGLVQRPLLRLHSLRAGARDTVDGPWDDCFDPPATRAARGSVIAGAALAIPPRHCADLAAKGGVRRRPPPLLGRAVRALLLLSVSSFWWSAPARSSSSSRGRASRPYCSRRAPPSPASPSSAAPRPSSSSNHGGSSGRSSAACAAKPAAGGRRAGRRVDEGRRRRGRRAGPVGTLLRLVRRQRRRLGHRGPRAGAEQPGAGGDRRLVVGGRKPRLGPSALPRDGSRKLFTQALEDSYGAASPRSGGSSCERMV